MRPSSPSTALPFTQTLRFRLSVVVGVVILCAVLAIAALGAWRGFDREISSKRALIAGAASGYAAAIADPVAELDQAGALSVLRGVRDLPGIVQSEIRLTDGKIFVQLGTGAVLLRDSGNGSTASIGDIWQARHLHVEMPIVKGGKVIGTLGLLADISELHVAVVDGLKVSFLSAFFAIVIGVLAAQFLISSMTRPLRQLTTLMGAFADDEAATIEQVRAGRDESGVLAATFNTMIESIRDRDARLTRHLETLEDQVEARTVDLRLARDEAEAANAAKSDFLATMSHEIRTPMNGMLVMAEMLSAADLSTRHRRYADIIARSGTSLLTIINDILDISKIESGKLDLERIDVSPDALVRDVASLFWEGAREKGLELVSYVSPRVPEVILGDPTRLNQIVTNLVNNALKFTETGGVEIRVDAQDCPGRNAAVLTIEVEDTGVGIPHDKLDHVFEAFAQADQSTTRRFGGTGLGLAVCRRLVEAMGGEIGVRSTVGQGSIFRVRFEADVTKAAPPLDPQSLRVAVRAGGGQRQRALIRSLSDHGCEIVAHAADFVVATSDLIGSAPTCAEVVISDIGDTRADELLASGRAVDLLPDPFTRADMAALVACASRKAFRGHKALESALHRNSIRTFEGLRVLAVDDNAVNREVLREALLTLKADMVFAQDGLEAVRRATAERFDVILMDGSMPKLDGFEATRRIRAFESVHAIRRTPIFALTAQSTQATLPEWRDAGADDHISKPFTLDRLVAILSRISTAHDTAHDAFNGTHIGMHETSRELLDQDTISSIRAMGEKSGRDVLGRVWTLFRTAAPDVFEEMCQMLAAGASPTELSRRAHALKSMALSSGASELAALCSALEADAVRPDKSVELKTQVEALGTCLTRTLAEMSKHSLRPAA